MPLMPDTGLSAAGMMALGIIFIPLLGAFFVLRAGLHNEKLRDKLAIGISGTVFILAALLFRAVLLNEGPLVLLQARAGFMEPFFLLRADMLSATITVLAALIWFLATLFSPIYMDHEKQRNRYYLFYLLSLGSCLGVFLAGDFLTLFLFFEIMTFASYVLVIHAESDEAMEAGQNYLFLGVGGGLSLLSGLFLLYTYTGTLEIAPAMEALSTLGPERYVMAALLILGFGVKAGMAPVHIWLPQAHPVAPAPASALLSGLMIKTGAYGIIRVLNMVFTPADGKAAELWLTSSQLGYIIIWAGIVTMFMAAFLALFQTNAKRILAYSSVSQMGYILMGLGAAAFMGYEEGAMGLSGAVYHITNHAFFKAAMFLIVGAIYVRTHKLDITRLGGLWRNYPVMTGVFLMAAGGITGVPLLNGYTSKTILHHAIEDAFIYSGLSSLYIAERIFTITSIFTVCYISKLTYGIFFGPRPAGFEKLSRESATEKAVFGVFGAAILALGTMPGLLMNKVFLPAAAAFSFYPGKIEYLGKLNVFVPGDLWAIAQVLVAGAVFFLLAGRWLNKVSLPGFFSIEKLVYRPGVRLTGLIYTTIFNAVENTVEKSYINSPYPLRLLTMGSSLVETAVEKLIFLYPYPLRLLTRTAAILNNGAEKLIVESLPGLLSLSRQIARFELAVPAIIGKTVWRAAVSTLDYIYDSWHNTLNNLAERTWTHTKRGFYMLIKMDYQPKGIRIYEILNNSNLEVSLMLMIVLLLVIFSLWFI